MIGDQEKEFKIEIFNKNGDEDYNSELEQDLKNNSEESSFDSI
jgi:hypothetical protein